jgi:DNA-binding transcriptional ArsR family regulator
MDQDEKWDLWKRLNIEKSEVFDHCVTLEGELSESRLKLRHLEEILEHLAPLAGVGPSPFESFAGVGMTVAITSVFEAFEGDFLSATDVRAKLAERGFDFSTYTVPMASIYKVLSRLEEAGKIVKKREDGKVFYSNPPSGAEITDDDIPF